MAFAKTRGTYGDPLGNTWSIWGGTSEFENFWDNLGNIQGRIPELDLPMGPIRIPRPRPPREVVSPVVISEIPRTVSPVISPQDTRRGALPSKIDVPEFPTDDEALEELLEERRELEEIIARSPIGTGTLPPIDEEKWGEIIRTPVPVPVDDSEFEDEEMAHTFTHGLGELALGWAGQQLGVGQPAGFVGSQTAGQTEAWLTGTTLGTEIPGYPGRGCKRRRRQRNILTQSNLNMLFQIATLPNNANVRVALSRAIK